jgi:O-antigen ligase
MTYAAIVKNQLIIGRDFQELIKLLLYFLIFALIANQDIKPTSLKHYYKFALVVLMLSAFFGFMQYIDLAGVNQILSPYYAPTQMRACLFMVESLVQRRILMSLVLLWCWLYLCQYWCFIFKERKIRLLCWGALPVFGLALVLTMSRSSLVATFLAVGFILLLFIKQRGIKHKWKRILTLVAFAFIIGIFILQFAPENALFRYSQLASFTESTSWLSRVENWNTHITIWIESPWFGWGPGKATMGTIVDNEWLLYPRYVSFPKALLLAFIGIFFASISSSSIMAFNPQWLLFAFALAFLNSYRCSHRRGKA